MAPEFAIGFLPFIILFIAVVAVCIVLLPAKLSPEDMVEIAIGTGTIWLTIMFIMIFMSLVCFSISPTERFTDAPSNSFLESLAKTEETVCAMMKETDNFIQGEVGQAGTDNPPLIKQVQAAALSRAITPTLCPPQVTPTMETAADRLSRMELTLANFVEPEFVKTFKSTQTCEGFADVSNDLEARLKKVQTTIHRLNGKYLEPIHQKTAELQKGILSDCDRKKGAATASKP